MDVFRYGFLSEITCLSSSKTAILSWSLCFFFGLRRAKTNGGEGNGHSLKSFAEHLLGGTMNFSMGGETKVSRAATPPATRIMNRDFSKLI